MTIEDTSSDHICFLVHGLQGAPGDLSYLASALRKQHVLVHAVECNWRRTTDGIAAGGRRVAVEITQVIARNRSQLRYISLVGFSLGGLYVRSALEWLVDCSKAPRLVAGLKPHAVVFVATPHLGVRSYGWWRFWPRWTHGLAGLIAGRTGRELFLLDADREPLLLRMAQNRTVVGALESFRIRLLVANLCYDLMVSAGTSLIIPHEHRYRVPATDLGGCCVLEDAHVCGWTIPDTSAFQPTSRPETATDARLAAGVVFLLLYLWMRVLTSVVAFVQRQIDRPRDHVKQRRSKSDQAQPEGVRLESYETRIATALNKLSWRRYAVAFDVPWVPTHNRIIAWSRNRLGTWLWRDGRPVVEQIVAFMELSRCVSSVPTEADICASPDASID
jgi:hypothetical protein